MIVLALQIAVAVVTLAGHAALATHYVRKARDSALRAGVAVVMARQSADRAEGAAGLVAFPEARR